MKCSKCAFVKHIFYFTCEIESLVWMVWIKYNPIKDTPEFITKPYYNSSVFGF